MAWTEEQRMAIDQRNSSILVSAAAGSGKTAVLVERILKQVLDEENLCDIDEFLVVTFTNAAAAQMRDKISARLEQALHQRPESEHLMKQLLLVNRADITTIDSFCLRLVKEHFSLLNLDSAFNIGDPGMMALLKNDILEQMFEEKYQSRDEAFVRLVDMFCDDRTDDKLREIILKIYDMAASYPIPAKWIQEAEAALMKDTVEELSESAWMGQIIALMHHKAEDALRLVEQGKAVCAMQGGPDKNYAVAESDEIQIQRIAEAVSYEELHGAVQISWKRLAICKGDGYDMELVARFKELRQSYKDLIQTMNICRYTLEEILCQLKTMREYLLPLLSLVQEFTEVFAEKKEKRKLMEFSDVEHMAYRLVCSGYDDEGNPIPTEVGREISKRYREIFIDEYQDSNYLQEDILVSVSGRHRGVYNMFMVGDVKQSIYRFRMARPDLFIKKYKSFQTLADCDRAGETGCFEHKLELKNNFRSRAVVLQAVNYFFYQLMGEDLGGIEYDEQIALVPTKEFPSEQSFRISDCAEIMIAESQSDEEGEENTHAIDKLELEANMIAARIKELVNEDRGLDVYDEEAGVYRRASYRDIVILARSVKGFGETVYNALTAQGIPVYLDDPKGYFNAVEIKTILSLLAVIDNCRQDIPLAATLLSPIGNMTENELAVICDYAAKKLQKDNLLYDKCICYAVDNEDVISGRLDRIFDIIDELKADKTRMSISELIWKAVTMTGFYAYAEAMPMGEKRKANIDMLLEKADSFENGYYKGLFNFLRYVEKLKINDVDFGEANIVGDNEDVVRILSMHKSKGLEYPIVFVSGLGRQFNHSDSKENLIIHSDYYLASMVMNTPRRYKKKSFLRECFKLLIKNENAAEELRVLYVAMTRAKEKLILTAGMQDAQKVIEMYGSLVSEEKRLLPYGVRQEPKSFMHLILAGMARYEWLGQKLHAENILSLRVIDCETILSSMVGAVSKAGFRLKELRLRAERAHPGAAYRAYKKSFDYIYPYQMYTHIKSKMSISEIKRMRAYDGQGYDIAEDGANIADIAESTRPTDKTEGINGATRGTLIHKFMELLPFGELEKASDYHAFLADFGAALLEKKVFDERELRVIRKTNIYRMLCSDLGGRMIRADARGELYKEQQFSIGLPASEIYADSIRQDSPASEDVVIVQGIVDAFFYEDGKIILMDYKTDHADEEALVCRYRAQLDYYAETLERLTGCRVSEKIIYSFFLNREILLPTDTE